jgi:DNA-binding NarL/FixJ family response regulator
VAVTDTHRVLVADDHAPTRSMVRTALESGGFSVCAEAATADAAVRAAQDSAPDVVMLDVRMPGGGIQAASWIRAQQPALPIVMLTVSAEHEDLFSSVALGVSGYWLKGDDPGILPDMLRAVLSGASMVSGSLVEQMVPGYRASQSHRSIRARLPEGVRLTRKEWEVLMLLEEGCTTSDIAARLYIADVTVRSHIKSIKGKLDVSTRAGILRTVRSDAGS